VQPGRALWHISSCEATDGNHGPLVPGIVAEKFLSRNTIKSEVNSILPKLGASSRSQAVTRCCELGLLEG